MIDTGTLRFPNEFYSCRAEMPTHSSVNISSIKLCRFLNDKNKTFFVEYFATRRSTPSNLYPDANVCRYYASTAPNFRYRACQQ